MNGRVIVITGATGGLGGAAARAFAEVGASLALLGHDQNKLDVLARELNLPAERALTLAVDLRDAAAVQEAAEAVAAKFGRINALIHLVGGWTGGKTLPESSADEFASMLDQHAWTTFHLFKELAPRLAYARQTFSDAARAYSAATEEFPTRWVARLFGMRPTPAI